MGKLVLFGCYGIPGWGGASTATYRLVETMRGHGLNAGHVNIIDEQDPDYFRYVFGENYGNPEGLDNVHNCHLTGPLNGPHPELTALLRNLSPDVMVAVGDIAARLMKRAHPEIKLVFLGGGGGQQVKQAILKGKITDLIEQERTIGHASSRPKILAAGENEAIATSDLIIAHSEMTVSLFRYFFPSYVRKLYPDVIWFAEWIYEEALTYSELARPFAQREIDVLFISNSWERKEKNYGLVKEIVSQLGGSEIHIVGEVVDRIPSATYHGLLTRCDEVFRLMGNAKAVVCPSLFDTAPGILFEASAMGCNIVASKNCGNWRICNDALLVDPCAADTFVEKTALAISRKLQDNMRVFLQSNSYENLVETLSVL